MRPTTDERACRTAPNPQAPMQPANRQANPSHAYFIIFCESCPYIYHMCCFLNPATSFTDLVIGDPVQWQSFTLGLIEPGGDVTSTERGSLDLMIIADWVATIPANTRHIPCVVSMLGHRRPTLKQYRVNVHNIGRMCQVRWVGWGGKR